MANFKIIPAPNFNTQLSKGSKEAITRIISTKALFKSKTIIPQIGKFLADTLLESDVIKALLGNGSVDLQAHFGLTDDLTVSLINGMLSLVQNSVKMRVNRNNQNLIIQILAGSTEWENYRSIPGAKYISESSGITIPVSDWLLISPDIDIGQAAYDIVFDGNQVDLKRSRSGRALMVELSKISGGSPYILPDVVHPRQGKNFIEYTLSQPQIGKKVMEIVMGNI